MTEDALKNPESSEELFARGIERGRVAIFNDL
jgi:hypothetical protein